jgi:hypothetical protein
VAGEEMASAIGKMTMGAGGGYDLKIVGGCRLRAMDKGGKLTLTDEAGGTAHVTIADVKQSNGVSSTVSYCRKCN